MAGIFNLFKKKGKDEEELSEGFRVGPVDPDEGVFPVGTYTSDEMEGDSSVNAEVYNQNNGYMPNGMYEGQPAYGQEGMYDPNMYQQDGTYAQYPYSEDASMAQEMNYQPDNSQPERIIIEQEVTTTLPGEISAEGLSAGELSILMGVSGVIALEDSNDLVLIGKLEGTVMADMGVYITNHGDDDNAPVLTVIKEVSIDGKVVEAAKDCDVEIRIYAADIKRPKTGTVIYTKDISMQKVHDTYIKTLEEVYVEMRGFEFTDDELDLMSITDCVEAWRLFNAKRIKTISEETAEEKEINNKKMEHLATKLCNRILTSDYIYVLFSKATGEPYMISKTVKRPEGYLCTPPDIMLITEAYVSQYSLVYPKEKYDIVKIENGDDKKGIENFLKNAFYNNGACGAAILTDQTAIDAAKLVEKPDFSNIPEHQRPVINPELVRWMLLIGQMGKPETEDAELIYRLHYRFLATAMTKAKLLVPMKAEGDVPTADETGKAVLTKDTKIMFPTMPGKKDKKAVRMYTDWKHLRMEFNEEWGAMVQPLSGMIEQFDCALNVTKFPAAACYVSKEMYDGMLKIAEEDKQ